MMERIKPFWFALVTLLVSVTLLIVASCGGDSDEDTVNDGTGGPSSPAGGGTSGGGVSGSGSGSSGTSGGGSMTDAGPDGAPAGPISTGTVPENGTCAVGGMTTMMPVTMTGTCSPSGTNCPGGSAPASDCAEGLVCCIDTDQCEALASNITSGGFVQSVSCVTTGTCPASGLFITTAPLEFQMGCPAGQSCCITLPDGGFSLEGGLSGLLEGGLSRFEGGFPGFEGGSPTPTTDAGQSQ
jgi:hypothetical protein